MAPKRVRKIKKIDAINKEFVKTLEKIDVEEIDFGGVVFSDETLGVELESVEEYDEIVASLEQFLVAFKEQKEVYENNKLSGMVNEQLKAGGDNAKKLLALLSGESDKSSEKGAGNNPSNADVKPKPDVQNGQTAQPGRVDKDISAK